MESPCFMNKLLDWERESPKALRVLLLVLCDIALSAVSTCLSLLLRYEFNPKGLLIDGSLNTTLLLLILNAVLVPTVFSLFKIYNSLWAFASVEEALRIVFASATVTLLQTAVLFMLKTGISLSYPVLFALLLTFFILISRFSYRFLRRVIHGRNGEKKRTMLIGAGRAGALAIREFKTSDQSANQVVCLIDDDPKKTGTYLSGVKIVGTREKIAEAVEEYRVEEIIFAIPTASNRDKKDIFDICAKTHCKLKTLPGIYQLANGEVTLQQIHDVNIEDLLGRNPIKIDMSGIGADLAGKTVLVTGGGGSIGSELCRQLATYPIARLIIFDIYENNAYEIQQELRRDKPELELVTLIGSVRDEKRLEQVFEEYHPDIVYHAAAHKHVPLMEDSPCEAVKNNIFGTLNTAKAAKKFGAKRFVLISTDKAVNPTNVMGASKRVCEMIVQTMNRHSDTDFVAVRFGNVLGSNGSVIPLFKKQIEKGGPVTVTHKDIIRYFMTIPEAVSLILQAGTFAKGGEIFILDMGEPVRIDDLARKMIRLSGFEPDVDIPIVYSGLRPGEKLFEELLMDEEGIQMTDNELIFIGHPIELDEEHFLDELETLRDVEYEDFGLIRQRLRELVPTYHEPETEITV